MPHDVNIRIESKQDNGMEKTELKQTKQGEIYNKNGTLYLRYEEDLLDLKGVKTVLKIKQDSLTLIRRGDISSIQCFIPGKKTEFDYQTPYGKFKFKLEVKRFDIEAKLAQGKIDLVYTLYNQGQNIGDNRLSLSYKGV